MDYEAAVEISCFSSERDGFGTERRLGGEPNPEQCLCGRSQTQSTADWLKDSSPVSVPVVSVRRGKGGLAAQGGLGAVQVPIFIIISGGQNFL